MDGGPEPDAGTPAEEPRTETTLTTRIRINIPGSRPIPPVVMRTPVGEDQDGQEGGAPRTERTRTPAAGASAAVGAAGTAGAAAAAMSAGNGSGGSGSGGSGPPGGGEPDRGTSDWFAPRKPPRRSTPPPGSTGGPGAGGGSGPAPGRVSGVPFPPRPEAEEAEDHPRTPPEGVPSLGLDDSGGGSRSAIADLGGAAGPGTGTPPPPAGPGLPPEPGALGVPGGLGGATTGPDTGDMPLPPFPPAAPRSGEDRGIPGPARPEPPDGSTLGLGTGPSMFAPGATPPGGPTSSLYTQEGPGESFPPDAGLEGFPPGGPPDGPGVPAPGMPPGAGAPGGPGGGGTTGAPDDTPGGPGGPSGPERIASDTLVSGIPRVPSADSGSGGPAAPQPPAPATGTAGSGGTGAGAGSGSAPARKGRSKLVLVAVAVVAALGISYGAGLLVNHADVPNGTTVLGVDIGGKDKQTATDTLEKALADRMTTPITVVVGDRKTELKPSVAGLTIDTETTVRNVAGRDYNPVSVIGSLFGGSQEADAAIEVDHDKLKAALSEFSGTSGGKGAAQDGMVSFEGGEAKAVPGKTVKAVDVGKAADKVEAAYRDRAATGKNSPVTLPVSTRQPEFGDKELQAAVDGFGKTAMSGWVWLRAGDVEVPFSEQTLGTFLTMERGGDKLQPVIDTAKLKETYGTAFDNVVIEGAGGTVEMTPRHAAIVMIEALREPAPPDGGKRIAEVENSRSQ